MQFSSAGHPAPDKHHHARIQQWIANHSNIRSHSVQLRGTELELSMLDTIGEDPWTGGGVTAEWLQTQLKASKDVSKIRVLLNSPGGDYFEGVAIHNLLKRHGALISVEIIGHAASAASVVAMAGDEIAIHDGAMLMVHEAWSFAMGRASDLESTAALLRKVNESAIDIYEKRTGLPRTELVRLVEAETWIKADDAVATGWADSRVPARTKSSANTTPRAERPYSSMSYVQRAALKKLDPALFAKLRGECADPEQAPPQHVTLGQMLLPRRGVLNRNQPRPGVKGLS